MTDLQILPDHPTKPNEPLEGATTEIYKSVPEADLELHVFQPVKTDDESGEPRPAVVFFFGGGWQSGSVNQFSRHARHFANRGLVAVVANYRVRSRHGTDPIASVEDARSAMRYVKANAKRLGIDPDRVVAAGGSAGGHLALCTGMATTVNAEDDDLAVNPMPVVVVGFNPVADTGPEGFAYERFPSGRALEASPVHLAQAGVEPMPSVLMMHGDEDTTVPLEHAERLAEALKAKEIACELFVTFGVGHGFFNNSPYFEETLNQMDAFLVKHGLLESEGK